MEINIWKNTAETVNTKKAAKVLEQILMMTLIGVGAIKKNKNKLINNSKILRGNMIKRKYLIKNKMLKVGSIGIKWYINTWELNQLRGSTLL